MPSSPSLHSLSLLHQRIILLLCQPEGHECSKCCIVKVESTLLSYCCIDMGCPGCIKKEFERKKLLGITFGVEGRECRERQFPHFLLYSVIIRVGIPHVFPTTFLGLQSRVKCRPFQAF